MSFFSRICNEAKAAVRPAMIFTARVLFYDFDVWRQRQQLKEYSTGIIQKMECSPVDSNVFAIFVYYEPQGEVSNSVSRVITALRNLGVNIVLACNHELSQTQKEFFNRNCFSILLRDNQGFDFGAYKDALSYMYESNLNVKRLFIMNDSVFYAHVGLDEMLQRMLSHEDVVAAFENWREGHHLQSFLLSISEYIYRSKSFKDFWYDYEPINNRRYAIEYGEKKLSSAILKSARTSHVVYSIAELFDATDSEKVDFTKGEIWVPLPWRSIAKGWGNKKINKSFKENSFKAEMAQIVGSSSPIHAGAYLFPKVLKCPLVKKDLVFRKMFEYWEIGEWSKEFLEQSEREELLTFLRIKSDGSSLSIKDKFKVHVGVK